MKLKSFGCSFIYGSDLEHRDQTWPALLAQHHNLEYHCCAKPGTGNLHILESVLNELADPEPAVYVIGWTWIDRFDYTHASNDSWQTILPGQTTVEADQYYRLLHSQYRDKLTTLVNIKTAQDAVLAQGHKLIMTYMDDLIFETEWHTSPAIEFLQTAVKPKMTEFESQSFLEWSKTNGHKISPKWHPLESAHRAGFELIKSYNLV